MKNDLLTERTLNGHHSAQTVYGQNKEGIQFTADSKSTA